MTETNFGIDQGVPEEMERSVTLIIHAAANISFRAPLAKVVRENCLPALRLAEMSTKFTKLENFTQVSTAFANSFLPNGPIEEKVYYLANPDTAEAELDEIQHTGSTRYLQSFPWAYAYSKQLMERSILARYPSIPLLLLRPSSIGPAIAQPYEMYGPQGPYSLIESVDESGSYATHPVVHRWAYYFQEASSRQELAQLAVMIVGWAVPSSSSRNYSTLQRRLLPHAQACSSWVGMNEIGPSPRVYSEQSTEDRVRKEGIVLHGAFLLLGLLYADQGKLDKAEKMYQRALLGYETALGIDHTSTLNTVNNLGTLYADQGKLDEAEKMYQRALLGYEKALDANFEIYLPALNTMWGLASLCERQADLPQAKLMYTKALNGYTKAVGPNDLRLKRLRERLLALNSAIQNNTLEGEQEPLVKLLEGSLLDERGRPAKSKRHKLLQRLGLQ